jgi:hypothetical protein
MEGMTIPLHRSTIPLQDVPREIGDSQPKIRVNVYVKLARPETHA